MILIKELEATIWEREFTLPVEYDCYKGEKVTEKQIEAVEAFVNHPEWVEKSKQAVEKYCRDAVLEDDENEKKDNVFSYIKPDYLFVVRDDKKPRVALICKYRYDQEHGLAIAFTMDGKSAVKSPDLL